MEKEETNFRRVARENKMDERHKIIQNLDPLEKLRIYMHYYIRTWDWNKKWDMQTKSFQDWIGDDNIQVRDHGPNWENFGFAQRYVTHEYGIYYWYWRFKDDNFTHKPCPAREVKKLAKTTEQQHVNKGKIPQELIGRSFTMYRMSCDEASKMLRRDRRKGDRVMMYQGVTYLIHRERFWWIKYYGIRIKRELMKISGTWAAKIKR